MDGQLDINKRFPKNYMARQSEAPTQESTNGEHDNQLALARGAYAVRHPARRVAIMSNNELNFTYYA